MQSVSDIIDKLDGASAVAKLLRLPASTVASWKSRNSIPVKHWSSLASTAQQRGLEDVTIEGLMEAHTEDQRVAS